MSRPDQKLGRIARWRLKNELRRILQNRVAALLNLPSSPYKLGGRSLNIMAHSHRRLADLANLLVEQHSELTALFVSERFGRLGISARRRRAWVREAILDAHRVALAQHFDELGPYLASAGQ